jgi:hypothetical protein
MRADECNDGGECAFSKKCDHLAEMGAERPQGAARIDARTAKFNVTIGKMPEGCRGKAGMADIGFDSAGAVRR